MKKMSRREFIGLAMAGGASIGLMAYFGPRLVRILSDRGQPPLLWLQAAGCTGCTVSLLNSVEPDVGKVLRDVVFLEYHPTLMAQAGNSAFERLFATAKAHAGDFYLVVEGGIPTACLGEYCTVGRLKDKHVTALEAVRSVGASARAVVAAGNCASYGGIAGARPNVTGTVGVRSVLKNVPIVNVPNCPAHPERLLGTLVYLIDYQSLPKLDQAGRPQMFYRRSVHRSCPMHRDYHRGSLAGALGEPGCLYNLGCKGQQAHSDCPSRRWNNGTGWCIAAGAPCIACSEPGFPDAFSPFFARAGDVSVGTTAQTLTVGARS